jgi:hypothetical protein
MKSNHHILGGIRPERAEHILTYLANIPAVPPVGTVLVPGSKTHEHTAWAEQVKRRYPQIFAKCSTADMFELRHLLRAAWDDADLRRREWFCFLLRKLHAESEQLAESLREDAGAKLIRDAQVKKDRLEYFLKSGERRPVAEMLYNLSDSDLVAAYRDANPPALNEFESAVFHLQRNLNHALHCRNPNCEFPYFFLTKKGQKYCGMPACSEWGQRESKRKWWREHPKPKPKRKSKKRR